MPVNDDRGQSLRPLLVTQFLGAFNDNAWKLVVAVLAMREVSARIPAGPALEAASQNRAMAAFVVFTLPLLLVSIPAGALADRFSKRSVLVWSKALELLLMLAATASLLVTPSGTFLPLAILGLMGAQAALFSPAKYGILPDLLPHERLSAGNAQLETWTFLAIIAGSALGPWLLGGPEDPAWVAGAVLTALSVAGLVAARAIPPVPASRERATVAETLRGAWSVFRADRVLRLAILGSAFFWSLASLLGQDVLVYIKSTLQVSDRVAGLPLAVFGLGVGIGALLAARLSASNVEYGLIPLGSLGLAGFTLVLGLIGPDFRATLIVMVFLGIASGLLIVPLNALIQWRAPSDRRGGVIALANVFAFAGILLGSLAAAALSMAGVSARGILVAAAVLTVAGTIWAIWLLPVALLRLVLVLLTHTFYRLRVVGRTHVPETGPALLVPNHVSFVDGLLLLASVDRPIRFVVDSEYFSSRLFGPFLRSLRAIPISSSGGPRVILRALRDAGRFLDAGDLVCIFAEGQITRTGMMNSFRRGLERIAQGRSAPLIPTHLDRVWGSIFSRARGRFMTKLPERIPYPVTVSFGEPMPSDSSIHAVRQAVVELGSAAASLRSADRPPLPRQFVRQARHHPFAFAFAELARPRMSRIAALAGAVSLARGLRARWQGQEFVGILLPPSIASALVNLAAGLAGRASVNINFTAGRAGIESVVRQAGLRTVVTSRDFVTKANVEVPAGLEPIFLEDVALSLGPLRRAAALALSALAPARLLQRACGAPRASRLDDTVTVIFSSGSTGEPKGVILTHFNVDANVEAVAQVFPTSGSDRLLGILPHFHSFGYLLLWFSANHRVGTVFHPNPLDSGAVGELVQRHRITILVATPTFLQLYLRRCTPAQFGALRLVLVGAEKLQESLAAAFEGHFGIRPLEGYGTTECAPAIAVSTLDYRAPGFFQPGSRRGFVGQPLPGIAVRVVDPESFRPLPPGTPGMLLVRGPNVMKGYLGRDDLTARSIRDGWYVTGDIALVDEDGFIQVTDRLSRFSKIGGEMVPHGRIEEALHQAAGSELQIFAVTAIPDERKGERLAVLHTIDEAKIPEILRKVQESGLPNLFVPRLDHFVKVAALPILGTGKLDLRETRRIAAEALSASSAVVPQRS